MSCSVTFLLEVREADSLKKPLKIILEVKNVKTLHFRH